MPRGGARVPGAGKKLGRPKLERSLDNKVAAKIKQIIKAEELWKFAAQTAAMKAKQTGNTGDLVRILVYLDDRDMGKCPQNILTGEVKPSVPELDFGNLVMSPAGEPGKAGKPN